MLTQIHQQSIRCRSKTELVAQKDISSRAELCYWVWEIMESHPLKDGYNWLFVEEWIRSPLFVQDGPLSIRKKTKGREGDETDI